MSQCVFPSPKNISPSITQVSPQLHLANRIELLHEQLNITDPSESPLILILFTPGSGSMLKATQEASLQLAGCCPAACSSRGDNDVSPQQQQSKSFLPSAAGGSLQIPGWHSTGWLLLSPRGRHCPAILQRPPETESQGMHALQHTGTRLQVRNFCSLCFQHYLWVRDKLFFKLCSSVKSHCLTSRRSICLP